MIELVGQMKPLELLLPHLNAGGQECRPLSGNLTNVEFDGPALLAVRERPGHGAQAEARAGAGR